MRIDRFSLGNFRNLENFVFEPCGGVNIIYGENAQGKTNIMEAVWLCTGSKSFRGAREAEMIAFGRDEAAIKMNFTARGRDNVTEIRLGKNKSVLFNKVEQRLMSKLSGTFCAVVFSPSQLSFVDDGPEMRRRLIDAAVCQIKPGYRAYLTEYVRILQQRNTVLRDMELHPELAGLLELWDERLAASAVRIVRYRRRYAELLSPFADETFNGISGGKERIELKYTGETTDREDFRSLLVRSRDEDLRHGTTSVGPHRDDLEILINGRPARRYGSQGQKRSAVLALKLAEASILTQSTGEQPVILLDDIMSELDASRQDYILNRIDGRQVFITCCEMSQVMRLKAGRSYHIAGGRLTERKAE